MYRMIDGSGYEIDVGFSDGDGECNNTSPCGDGYGHGNRYGCEDGDGYGQGYETHFGYGDGLTNGDGFGFHCEERPSEW